MSFVEATFIDVGDQVVAIPRPDGWRAVPIDGDWMAAAADLARERCGEPRSADEGGDAEALLDPADAEGAVATFVSDSVRDVLADLDAAMVVIGLEEGERSTLVASVLCVAVLAESTSFADIVASTIEAHARSGPGAGPTTVDTVDLPERTMLRVASVDTDEEEVDGVRATFTVHLLASDTIVVLAGAAIGAGAGILVDVWGDIATEVAAVSAGLPDPDRLIEMPS